MFDIVRSCEKEKKHIHNNVQIICMNHTFISCLIMRMPV